MLELARGIPDASVRVLAPAVRGDRAFDASSGCRTTRLRGARLGVITWLAELCVWTLWECLVRRPDLIVCGHYVSAPAAFITHRLLRIPYVVFAYGHEVRRKRVRRVQRVLLQNCRMVVACSRFTRSAVLDIGVSPNRARVLYPGVDARTFAPRPEGTRSTRQRTLLTVSRLTDLYKGHDTLIRALPYITAKHPDVRYVIAGDGPLRGYLEHLSKAVGVSRNVEFPGEVSDEVLLDLYRTCDVFVLLSRESPTDGGAEGFGIVFLEAAACCKPAIAGNSGGISDAVEHGRTGILVDPENVLAVASAIMSLLDDPEKASQLGQAGRQMVLERFTWEHVMQDARSLFQEAAEKEQPMPH